MNKLIGSAIIALLFVIATIGGVSANHVPQSRYARWYSVIDSYPGGSFWSPQPVASTPVYGYYDDYYRNYNYPYRYSDSFGRYGYNRGTYNDYYRYQYNNNYRDPYCSGYSNGISNGISNSGCRNRIVYPQSGLGYYYDDPYYSSNNQYSQYDQFNPSGYYPSGNSRGYSSGSPSYPDYLSYGWEY